MLDNDVVTFEGFYSVPLVLKFMAEDPNGIAALSKLKLVMFGGSPLSDEIGERLVDNGIRLVGHYGTSELRRVAPTRYLVCGRNPAEVGQVGVYKAFI